MHDLKNFYGHISNFDFLDYYFSNVTQNNIENELKNVVRIHTNTKLLKNGADNL